MKRICSIQRGGYAWLGVVVAVATLWLITGCGVQEAQLEPTLTPTLAPIATQTPVPTDTPAPSPTVVPTSTPAVPTETAAATATAVPTAVPSDTPMPTPLITDTPTVTPVVTIQVSEAQVLFHDGQNVNGVGRYQAGISPWLDLLVRSDDTWYGPERQEDEIAAAPLPDGYRWETSGSFSSLPNGEAWWAGPGVDGMARFIGPDGDELYTLELRIEFY